VLKVRAIVPAAGLSRRFGGPNKLLVPWNGSTIVGTVVRTLLDVGLKVTVVAGRDADRVACEVLGAECVLNPNWENVGLGDSIAFGVSAAPESDGYLIALADTPSLSRQVVDGVLAAFEEVGPKGIIVPIYSEEPEHPGHPVLFGRAYRPELIALTGKGGARSILRRHEASLSRVHVLGRLHDVDTPRDL